MVYDQCVTREECDACRVYRSPRSRVLAGPTTGKPGPWSFPATRIASIGNRCGSFIPCSWERRKHEGGGVEVECAIRRAAPSRNSDQSVGIDSLCCWRLERYTPDHYLTSIRKKSHTCHLLHNSRRREHHENPNQGKWRSRSWQNSDLVSTGSGHQTPPWGYILSQY